MSRTHWKRLGGVFGALFATGAVAVAILVASGDVTVVTTSGTSMEPQYHQGDLVVVRSSDYAVGDIVAFRSKNGGTVLHRIIGTEGDSFVPQGDNNDWIDPDRPTADDIIGEAWLHVPGGGSSLAWLRGPLPASAMLAAVGMMLTRSAPADDRDLRTDGKGGARRFRATRRRRPDRSGSDPQRRRAAQAAAGLHARSVLAGAIVALLAASALGALAFSRPTHATADERLSYDHRGALSYSAPAPDGPVYDGDEIVTGDPLFLDLVDEVEVTFDYRLDAGPLRATEGTVGLEVELAAGSGWSRTVALGTPQDFRGTEASMTAPLDLPGLRALIDDVEAATSMRSGSYTVAITPTVELRATADGEPVTDEFTERHEFQLDDTQLRPASSATAPVEVGGRPVLETSQAGAVTAEVQVDETLSALGRHTTVSTARDLAVGTGAIALLVGLAALVFGWVAGPRTEADRISARYGRRIVDVDGGEGGEARTIIDVSNMAALVRLADHHDRLILHHRSDAGDTFMVDAQDTLYRHRVGPSSPQLVR